MTERDPLVAEGLERLLPLAIEEGDWPRVLRDAAAVRRPSRRRYVVIALAAVALAVLAPLTALAVSKGWWFLEHEAPKPVTPVSVIATGRWNGIPWVLTAYLSDTDGVCLAMTPQSSDRNAGGGAMSCDAIDGVTSPAPPKRFTPHRISYLSGSSGGKLPGWVAGPVVDTAREVDILFRNAPTIRVATIPAPESLRSRIRFYLAELPAGRATISEVIGRDGRGAVVARLHVPLPSFADPRFTMKNHGKQVTLSAAMKARLRAAHRVGWVRLLATRDGRNFYRFGSCFGVGPAGDPSAFPATAGPAAFGELLCGNQFPSPQRPLLDASAYRRGELVRLGGFAGDAVKIIELVDRHARGLGRAPVVANVYSAARVPRGVVALVAVGARGKRLARCSPAAC